MSRQKRSAQRMGGVDEGPESDGFTASPDLLRTYSALTDNGHLIHLDRRYATEVEGHRDLLVHGPLVALLAAEHLTRALGTSPHTFGYRLTAPTVVGHPLSFTVAEHDDEVRVTATCLGRVCVKATGR